MTTSTFPCVVSSPEALPVLGTAVEVFLRAAQTGGGFTAYRCVVPPAGGPPPHKHDAFDEAFTVLEGAFEILCGTEVHLATAGMTVFVPRGVPHTFRNVGEGPATFYGIATPAGHEEFFEDAARLEALDVPIVVALCARHGIEILPQG